MLFCASALRSKISRMMLQLWGCSPCGRPSAAAEAMALVMPGSASCPAAPSTRKPSRRRQSALPAPAPPRAGPRAQPGARASVGGREPGAAARARRARRRGVRVPAAPPAVPAHAAAAGRAHAARAAPVLHRPPPWLRCPVPSMLVSARIDESKQKSYSPLAASASACRGCMYSLGRQRIAPGRQP